MGQRQMKAVIVQFPFGTVALNEENNLIEKILLPKKPQEAAKAIMKIEAGKISDEIAALIALLRNAGYDTFVFENANLAGEAQSKLNVKAEVSKPSDVEVLRSRMEQLAVETGFVKEAAELSLWSAQCQHGSCQTACQGRR